MPNAAKLKTAPAQDAISILLADDHPALRAGVRSLLATEPDLVVQGDVANGEDAYAWYRSHHPDVVVIDLSMAGYGGLECLRRILQYDPRARVLAYTVHTADAMLARVLALGGLGYVTKASEIEVLLTGIREVAQRRGFVSPDMVPAMVRKHTAIEQNLSEQLGNRGFQIFLLTTQGRSVAECASILSLSEKTVRNHLTQIKAKLNVGNTADLTRLAIQAGLVDA